MTEIYKDVHGYEGLYLVSNYGNVKGTKRGNVLKTDDTSGYSRVTLSKDGKTTRFLVHRLVAYAFIPHNTDKPHVNHLDNDPLNNHVNNLEWCTHSENMIHAHKQDRLANIKASQAAIDINYGRYADTHKERLGSRFLGYYPFRQIKTTPKPLTKSQSAIKYLCSECEEARIALVGWSEIRLHNGICPNCQSVITVDEDIV